jgi:CheY-like chemotaxis protein
MSVLYFKLPGLAELNATEGHSAGDALLDRTRRILFDRFRGGDLQGPWVGSGFVVAMSGDRRTAERRLAGALADLDDAGIDCRGGVATSPEDGADVDALMGAAAARAEGLAQAPSEDHGSTEIAVVEDDPVVADLVSEILRARGYGVTIIDSGPGAIAELCRPGSPGRFSLVILDVTLPGVDGLGVLRAMGANGSVEQIPVVMLTARAGATDVRAALDLGAVDHVAKPFSPQLLLTRVERWLALDRSRGSAGGG